jgi:hypothetical protein
MRWLRYPLLAANLAMAGYVSYVLSRGHVDAHVTAAGWLAVCLFNAGYLWAVPPSGKATTPDLKELWAKVANERLESTGDEARAIREANAVIARQAERG